MILSDKRILEEIEKGTIIIEPFRDDCLGTNSHDVHLGKYLATYKTGYLMQRHTIKLSTLKFQRMGTFYIREP